MPVLRLTTCALFLVLLAAPALRAADVELSLSATESYVGVPVTVQIKVSNAQNPTRPIFPDIPGAIVRDIPGGGRMVFNFNGQVTETEAYTYQLIPQRAGRLTIPAIEVIADGITHKTSPRTLLVSKSETGDLLFVDLVGARDSVYVGETLDVTLRIWIKPFNDRRFQVKLGEGDMWGIVDHNNSQWGVFRDPLTQLASRGRRPQGRETTRNDSQGQPHAYYLYQLQTTMSPQRPGDLEASDISILLSYPVRLRRDESLFGMGNLTLDEARPVTAGIRATTIKVKPLPAQGRPAWFRDAVGSYDLTVAAKPADVAVGDPITLTLTLRGKGRLDTLQPPPLADIVDLTQGFKVPTDPLAGTVDGDAKRFTQTIRARDDKVTQIPPIPFTYFDPLAERYVTVRSPAIPLRVKPASQLAVSQIVQAQPSRQAPTQLTERAGGILPNYSDLDELMAQQAFAPGWPSALAAVLPPFAFAACWLLQRRSHRLRYDIGFARRRSAVRNARRALAEGARAVAADSARLAAAAVRNYVADRLNLPAGSLTADETIDRFAARGASPDAVRRLREFLEHCQTAQYAPVGGPAKDGVCDSARHCIEELEHEKL